MIFLFRHDDEFILDVADHDPEVLPEYADARPPGAGGLGLHLVRRFALDVGWYTTEQAKHVWAAFPVAASPWRP